MSNKPFIPWAEPTFWGNEESYVLDALRSTWISGGPYVERLERDLANYLGVRHALAVANGTAALHLAYLALNIGPGDEIVVPGFAFMAAANVALQLHARPVFVDVDPDTWCMRAEDVRQAIGPRTKAVVAVHSYGQVCAMPEIIDVARRHGIAVIEDAAEAFGSRVSSHHAGTLGAIGTYSFHATKTISTGEGGLVVTDDDWLAERMRLYRSHGLRRTRHYWHEVPGHNFRMTNLQAALGCAQFEHFDRLAGERRRVFGSYVHHLAGIPGIVPQRSTPGSDPLIWAVALLLDPSTYPQGRDAVMKSMHNAGIETRPGFQPPSEMKYFEFRRLPTSEKLGNWVLSLPSSPKLTDEDVRRICKGLGGVGENRV